MLEEHYPMNTITATEAAKMFNVSSQTIRRWIQSDRMQGFKENGQWFVQIDEQHIPTDVEQNNISVQHVQHLEDEIQYLRETLTRRDEQIESFSLQIEHISQLLAIAHKSVQQLSEQNQLLLEDNRKPWWKRIRIRRATHTAG
jgi:transposase